MISGWERRWYADLAAESPIVIMGRGHSGTRILTWVCERLGICLGAESGKETGDAADRRLTRRIKYIARRTIGPAPGAGAGWLDRLDFADAVRRYRRRLNPVGAWGWKFPETYLIAPIVHAVFPRARYLHVVRDGRDVAFKRHLTDDPRRPLGRRILRHLDVLDAPHHLQAARSWAYQVEGFEAFRRMHPEAAVLDLRFESLLSEPGPTLERLGGFLDMPLTADAADWLERHLEQGKRAQHRTEDPARVREVERAVGDVLRKWGYICPGEGGPSLRPAGAGTAAAGAVISGC